MGRWGLGLTLGLLAACGEAAPEPFVVVTFNTGTTEGLAHDAPPEDGYGAAQAATSDTYYGDGLAWRRAVDDTRAFFARTQPDVVGLQEIFYSGDCADIPERARPGFVCETWRPSDPTVALDVLGPGYQVACHPQKNDKCLAVRRDFARVRGCDADLCLDGLEGEGVPGCGRGARVAKAVLDLAAGGTLKVVHVHGSSGLSNEDVRCRVAQFEQVFGALGAQNVVLGDLNTDPVRLFDGDESAATFLRGATQHGLHFVTEVGEDAIPTYGGLLNIDHVLTDVGEGECSSEIVTEMTYFDHRPQVCSVRAQ